MAGTTCGSSGQRCPTTRFLLHTDQIAEAFLEIFRRHLDDRAEFGELLGVLKIFAFEADHVRLAHIQTLRRPR